jgi:prolyl-tRNA editing enzyme YbaK/EbsC (Cys-tRNA(Pro) deacylase)
VPVGAIVKTLIFIIDSHTENYPVVALVSGDKLCNTSVIPKVLGIEGKVRRPDANIVKDITGYSIGGVSPIGLPDGISIIMDTSLKRFDKIWSAAGHPHCVFPATFEELKDMTGAEVSDLISQEKEE